MFRQNFDIYKLFKIHYDNSGSYNGWKVQKTLVQKENERRIALCERIICKVAKSVNLDGGPTSQFQGCVFPVETEIDSNGRVIVLLYVGEHFGLRLSRYVTLTVHGVVWRDINRRVRISGGGIESSTKKFLPGRISLSWIKEAMLRAGNGVKEICTVENMKKLQKEALAMRRLQIKNQNSDGLAYMRHTTITPKKY